MGFSQVGPTFDIYFFISKKREAISRPTGRHLWTFFWARQHLQAHHYIEIMTTGSALLCGIA